MRARDPWAWIRAAAGAAILGVVVWRLGARPVVEAVQQVDAWSLLAAAAIAALTTACTAWRWSLVARGLGVGLPLREAFAACYRAQLLNATLPGGVVGDVHRGVRHGRAAGDLGRALRAVVWERGAGQVVQAVLAAVVLLLAPSPVHPPARPSTVVLVAAGAVLLVLVLLALARVRVRPRPFPAGRVVLASAVAVAGHAATFLVAAHAVGTDASVATLLPLTMLVLLAMAVPTSFAGWGPREGVAAWAFGAAGLGAAQGVAAAAAYGVMVLVASLPGAVVLLAGTARGRVAGRVAQRTARRMELVAGG